MSAYWLTYKPLSHSSPRGWPAAEMTELVRRFVADPASATPLWRIASHRTAQVGDRVYLFKQGSDPRGIFGTGTLMESPTEQADPTDTEGGLIHRARIQFNQLVDPARAFLLGYEMIQDIVPETLVAARQSGNMVPDATEIELEKRLEPGPPIASEQADDPSFDPDSVDDHRDRAVRAIRLRRGQPAFRADLLAAYAGRCAISGCAVKDVLEAAHITPYRGCLTNHVSNGLLLRADLHTLFDCDLISIDPENRTVVLAGALTKSSYAKFAGKPLRLPKDASSGPSKLNLQKRYGIFMAAHKVREAAAWRPGQDVIRSADTAE